MKPGSLRIFIFLIFLFHTSSLFAELIKANFVHLQILDKITSEIKNVNIEINTTHFYGTLEIEFYACYKNPPEEIPEDFALFKIFDTLGESSKNKVFQGWMISSSPSASPFEHPIYDIWIKGCKID